MNNPQDQIKWNEDTRKMIEAQIKWNQAVLEKLQKLETELEQLRRMVAEEFMEQQ